VGRDWRVAAQHVAGETPFGYGGISRSLECGSAATALIAAANCRLDRLKPVLHGLTAMTTSIVCVEVASRDAGPRGLEPAPHALTAVASTIPFTEPDARQRM